MADALVWAIIGGCAALAAVVIGAIIGAVIWSQHSPLPDVHYVD